MYRAYLSDLRPKGLGGFGQPPVKSRACPPGAAVSIASCIPPGPGGSIARNNDNVQFVGFLRGFLDASGGDSGRPPGVFGGLREASLGFLGASGAPRR